VLGSTTKSLFT